MVGLHIVFSKSNVDAPRPSCSPHVNWSHFRHLVGGWGGMRNYECLKTMPRIVNEIRSKSYDH